MRRRALLKSCLIGLPLAAQLPLRALGGAPLQVVASTGMIADAAAILGGAGVEVRALMGPGTDPHAYRQTRSDIVALTRADLVLWHGLYLEAQMEGFFAALANRQPVVAVAQGLPRVLLRAHDDYQNRFDPHVWMVPELWRAVVARIAEALSGVSPADAAAIAQRAEVYLAALERLQRYADQRLATVAPQARVLVTAHDAFGYFGAAFNFDVWGIQGISTESEAGLHRIRQMVDLLVARQIGAVFVESSVSDRNIRALIEGAAARGHQVRIAGELFSDAMGAPGSYEGTYIGMIDHNVTTITRALGGTAPARGMDGKLGAGGRDD